MIRQLSRQCQMGGVVFGGDDQAAGVPVDAVNDAGTLLAADAGEGVPAVVQQGVDQRAGEIQPHALGTGPCRPVVMQPGQLHEARQERRRLPHGQVGHHPIFQYLVAGQQHGAKDRIPHNVLLLHMDFGYGFIVPYRRRVCNRRLVNTMQEMPLIFNRTVTGL